MGTQVLSVLFWQLFFISPKLFQKNVYMKKRKTGSEKLNTNIPGKCK